MTWITINNVQRTVTPKPGNSKLRVLCYAHRFMEIYICIKFQENISNSFQVTEWTRIYYRNHYFQSSKGHNLKSWLPETFLCSTRCLTVLYICEKCYNDISIVFNLQSNDCVQCSKGNASKRKQTRVRFLCPASSDTVLYICVKIRENIECIVEMVIFNIFYVQRDEIRKVG